MTCGCLLIVWHMVFYYDNPENPMKHVVIFGKQRILRVDGLEDVEEHNQYCTMQLFTNLPNKIKQVEAHVEKSNIIPYIRTKVQTKL